MLSPKSFMLEWKLKGKEGRMFMGLGALFLLFALVGVFIPIIPQVPFAIISAYFFSKGSFRIHMWMRTNKYFGKPVREWEDFKIIRPKMKIISVVSMLIGAGMAHYKLDLPWALALDVMFLTCIGFVVTRRSKIFSFL